MPIRPRIPGTTPVQSPLQPAPVNPARTGRSCRVSPTAPPTHQQAPPTSLPNRNSDGSYIVGKNRPPQQHRFRPGVSGNPKGRPKGAKGIKTLTIEVLGARMPVKTAAGERKMNAPEFSLHKLRELAARNNLAAILAVLERWQRAVPDIAEDATADEQNAVPPSETDRAILDLFAEELRRPSTQSGGEASA